MSRRHLYQLLAEIDRLEMEIETEETEDQIRAQVDAEAARVNQLLVAAGRSPLDVDARLADLEAAERARGR